MTLSFALVMLISCNGNSLCVGIHFHYVLAIALVRMRRNNVNCASGL